MSDPLQSPLYPAQPATPTLPKKPLPDFGPPRQPRTAADPLHFYDTPTTGPDAPSPTKALTFYDQNANQRLATSVDLASAANPDDHARVLSLADKTGLPIDYISRNVDQVQRLAAQADFNAETFRKTSPALAEWLQDPDHAMVSGDDHSALQKFELRVQSIAQAWREGTVQGDLGDEAVPLRAQLARSAGGAAPPLTPAQAAQLAVIDQGESYFGASAADPTRGAASYAARTTAALTRGLIGFARAGAAPGIAGGAAGGAFAVATGQPELAVPAIKAGITAGGAVGAYKYAFDQSMGSAFQEFSQMTDEHGQPMDPKVASIASAGVGAINAALNLVGETALLKLIPAAKDILGAGGLTPEAAVRAAVRQALTRPSFRAVLLDAGKSWLHSGGINAGLGLAQEVVTVLGRTAAESASGQEFAAQAPGSDAARIGKGGLQGLVGGLGVGAILSSPRLAFATREVQNAQAVVEQFKSMADEKKDVKLSVRLPEAFGDVVQQMADTHQAPENVFVGVDRWQTYFQSGAAAAEAATQILGSPDQYQEALATNGDLVIPFHSYAEKVVGTPLGKSLEQDIRITQGALSLREAEEQQKEMEAVAGPIPDEKILTPEEKAAESFQTGIEAQLRETGASPAEAETQAQVPTAFFRTLGSRLGQNLFEKYRVSIARRESVPETVRSEPTTDTGVIPELPEGARRKPIAKQNAVEAYDHLYAAHQRLQDMVAPVAWARTKDDGTTVTGESGILRSQAEQATATFDKLFERLKSLGQTDDQIWAKLDDIQSQRDERAGMQGEQFRGSRGASVLNPDVPFAPDATLLFQGHGEFTGPTRGELLGSGPKGDAEGTPAERELFKAWSKLDKIDQKETGRKTVVDPAEEAVALQALIDAETNVQREKQGLPPVQTPVELPEVPVPNAKGPSLAEFTAQMQARLGEAGLKQDEKGAIQFSGPGPIREFNISLLPKADRSTFLHEMGHLFLEVTSDVASGADVPEQVGADMQVIRDWLGNDGTPFTEAQHEQFARGIEAYLLKGEAPSAPLRTAFARFRTWLVSIYRELRNLNVTLTPEVTSAMDRMLATDDEIAAARQAQDYTPLDRQTLGATEAEYRAYARATDRATTGAQDELLANLMNEERRASKEWWQAEEERTRADVSAELESDPAYQAIHYMLKGESLTGEKLPVAEDGKPVKLSKDLLVARYGKDILSELPHGLYSVAGGVDPDQMAHLFGFESGDDMVPALKSKKFAPFAREVERQTAARMDAKFPDLKNDSARLARAAQDAVHRGDQANVLLTELRLLGRQLGIRLPPRIDAVRAQAAELVGRARIRDLDPYRYQQAEAKNARLAEQAGRKGDLAAAHDFKRKQLLNHLSFRLATDMKEQAAKDAGFLDRYTQDAARARLGKIDQAYLAQVDGLLERFDFRSRSLRSVDRNQRLAEWIKDRTDEGTPPEISDELQQEAFATNWRNLKPGQLSDLADAVKNIVHLAGLKGKLLSLKAARDLEVTATEAGNSIREHGGRVREQRIGAPSGLERKAAIAGQYFASMRKLGSIVREMDGQEDNGPMFRDFLTPINDAQNREAIELTKAGHAFDGLFDRYYGRDESFGMSRVREAVPGTDLRLTHWDRLMIALNTGNEDNRTKLLDGYNNLDESKLKAVLGTLTKRDWDFVQGTWDLIGSYWPEIKAKQERVTGLAPEKVEAREVETPFGTYAGGYFPLVYDPAQSIAAYKDRIVDEATMMKQGATVRATTRRGHTMERVQGVKRPILLAPSVITNHLSTVVHDLTHHEMLIDVNRLIRHPEIESAIKDHYGTTILKEMQGHLTDIAAGSAGAGKPGEQFINYLRSGSTTALLGFNLVTSMLQGFGLSNSVVRIGAPWVARGMARWISSGAAGQEHTLAWIQGKSEFMQSRLENTQRDLREALTKIETPGRFTDMKASYFSLIARGQLLADIPTWLGAYEKAWATDKGMTESSATSLADQAVKDSQGGGMLVDLSRIEKGGPWQKLFTTFYTYGNVVLQQNIELAKRTEFSNPKSAGAFMVDALLLNVVPVAMAYTLKSALQGHTPDVKDLPGEFAAGLLNMLAYFRELVGLAQHRDSYEGPAGLRIIPQTYTLAQQIKQGEADATFWRSLNIEGGLLFHYPALQLQRTAEGAAALLSGKTRNPLALVGGPPH